MKQTTQFLQIVLYIFVISQFSNKFKEILEFQYRCMCLIQTRQQKKIESQALHQFLPLLEFQYFLELCSEFQLSTVESNIIASSFLTCYIIKNVNVTDVSIPQCRQFLANFVPFNQHDIRFVLLIIFECSLLKFHSLYLKKIFLNVTPFLMCVYPKECFQLR